MCTPYIGLLEKLIMQVDKSQKYNLLSSTNPKNLLPLYVLKCTD